MTSTRTERFSAAHPAGLLDLVGEVYQAGLEPAHWPKALARLSKAFDAEFACIYTPTVARPEQSIYITHNFTEASQAAYSAYYHQHDAWTQSALQQAIYIQGTIAFGEQLIAQGALHQTEFYQDFLKPNDMEWIITTALFDGRAVPGTPATHMTFTRHSQQQAFEANKATLIEQLAPHVRRALLIHWQLTQARLGEVIMDAALDQLRSGVILLDADGKVVYLNALAEALIRASDSLGVHAGRLHATLPRDQDALSRLIHEARIGFGGGLCLQPGGVDDTQNSTALPPIKRPYCLSAAPLREDFLPPSLMAGHGGAPRVLLLIQAPASDQHQHAEQQFASRHHLTPAELKVLNLLLRDMAPKQIAAQLGVGIRTVRSQLSSLYGKTGTRNQRELATQALKMGVTAH